MSFFEEFKALTIIGKFNFFASVITVTGLSLLSVLNVTQNFLSSISIFQIGLLFILTSFLLLISGILLGILLWLYKSNVKTESTYWSILVFIASILAYFGVFFVVTQFYIELVSVLFK